MGMIIQNGKVFSGEPKTTYTERVLWNGPATPTPSGSDITLSDNITNYDEIVFDLTSELGRKYQDNYLVSSLTIGSTYLEALYAAESQGVFWTYTNETSINIKRITTGTDTAITYNKITGIKYGDTVKRKDYHVYSTEEKIVGEWTDGSTLYEKTYSYSISSETSQEIATLDSNIVVKEIKGVIHNNGNDMIIPWIDASFFYNIYNSSAHKLTAIKKNTGDWTGQAVEITIRYTKSS